MKFKHVAIMYAVIGLLVVAGICIWEWNALKDFQISYVDEENRKSIFADMREENKKETEAPTVKEQEPTQSIQNEVTKPESSAGNSGSGSADLIQADVAELLGIDAGQVQETPIEDAALSQRAVQCLELYLKHINGMASLSDLQSVMRTDSKAYKAVLNSQQSLEWLIKSKSMTFTKEETTDMVRFDENHFACDVMIDLTKVPDTERERTVEESVGFRILFENINGSWYMYSFMTK